jgi:hypothetical protein
MDPTRKNSRKLRITKRKTRMSRANRGLYKNWGLGNYATQEVPRLKGERS